MGIPCILTAYFATVPCHASYHSFTQTAQSIMQIGQSFLFIPLSMRDCLRLIFNFCMFIILQSLIILSSTLKRIF